MLYPLKLKSPLKDYIWGGTRLKTEYGKTTDMNIVAESWELSCHKAGASIIENGAFKNKSLPDYLKKSGKKVIGTKASNIDYFPLLIKLIDAHDNLSVQVHPNDDYAQTVEGEPGKTEMWYIVDAEPDADGQRRREVVQGFAAEDEHRQDHQLRAAVRDDGARDGAGDGVVEHLRRGQAAHLLLIQRVEALDE